MSRGFAFETLCIFGGFSARQSAALLLALNAIGKFIIRLRVIPVKADPRREMSFLGISKSCKNSAEIGQANRSSPTLRKWRNWQTRKT